MFTNGEPFNVRFCSLQTNPGALVFDVIPTQLSRYTPYPQNWLILKNLQEIPCLVQKNMIFKDQGGGESTCINMRPRAPIYYNCGEIYTLVTDKSVESVTEVSFTQYTLIQIMYPQVKSNMASRTIHQFRMIFPANKTSIVVMFNCYDWWHWSIHWIQHH